MRKFTSTILTFLLILNSAIIMPFAESNIVEYSVLGANINIVANKTKAPSDGFTPDLLVNGMAGEDGAVCWSSGTVPANLTMNIGGEDFETDAEEDTILTGVTFYSVKGENAINTPKSVKIYTSQEAPIGDFITDEEDTTWFDNWDVTDDSTFKAAKTASLEWPVLSQAIESKKLATYPSEEVTIKFDKPIAVKYVRICFDSSFSGESVTLSKMVFSAETEIKNGDKGQEMDCKKMSAVSNVVSNSDNSANLLVDGEKYTVADKSFKSGEPYSSVIINLDSTDFNKATVSTYKLTAIDLSTVKGSGTDGTPAEVNVFVSNKKPIAEDVVNVGEPDDLENGWQFAAAQKLIWPELSKIQATVGASPKYAGETETIYFDEPIEAKYVYIVFVKPTRGEDTRLSEVTIYGTKGQALVQKPADNFSADFLTKLGIITGKSDLSGIENISRAQMAGFIAVSLGLMSEQTVDETAIFDDVVGDEALYINYMKALGIMDGMGDNMFYPEEDIKIEQAIKIAVCALGYKDQAEHMGGYPTGYGVIANKLGLLKNISNYYGTADGDTLIYLLFNMLHAQTMETEFITDKEESVVKGPKLMTSSFDVYNNYGVLSGNKQTNLSGSVLSGENNVIIDGAAYISENDITNYIGQTVNYYYKYDDVTGDKTIILMQPMEKKNNIINIQAEDLISVDYSSLSYYDEDHRQKDISLRKSDFLYNFKAEYSFNPEFFDWTSFKKTPGEIEAIDNNNDGNYEIISVKEYKYMIIGSVVTSGNDIRVIDKDDSRISVVMSDKKDCGYIVEKGGEEFNASNLAKNLVIKYAKSNDGKFSYIKVVGASLNGTITEKEAGLDSIQIDGVKYTVPNVAEATKYNYVGDGSTWKKGDLIGAYVNSDAMEIIRVNNIDRSTDYQYGFLIGFKQDSRFSPMEFKILTKNGKCTTFNSASNIKINSEKNVENFATELKVKYGNTNYDSVNNAQYIANNGRYSQMILYRINNDNNIVEIKTAKSSTDTDITANDLVNGYSSLTGLVYKNNTKKLDKFTLPSDVMVFKAPKDLSAEGSYRVWGLSSLTNNETYYNVEMFDFDDDGSPKVVVVRDRSDTVTSKTEDGYGNYFFVITKKVKAIRDDVLVDAFVTQQFKQNNTSITHYKNTVVYCDPDDLSDNGETYATPVEYVSNGNVRYFTSLTDVSQFEVGDICCMSRDKNDYRATDSSYGTGSVLRKAKVLFLKSEAFPNGDFELPNLYKISSGATSIMTGYIERITDKWMYVKGVDGEVKGFNMSTITPLVYENIADRYDSSSKTALQVGRVVNVLYNGEDVALGVIIYNDCGYVSE